MRKNQKKQGEFSMTRKRSLNTFKKQAPEARVAHERALDAKREKKRVREAAAKALEGLGPREARAALERALDRNPQRGIGNDVRAAAAKALGRIGIPEK